MPTYAMLVLPSANRVYGRAATELTVAELQVVSEQALAGRVGDVTTAVIGGVPYVTFAADELTARDIGFISNLSAMYALFERDGERLLPIELHRLDRFDDDLLTIQRYAGKTNEQFTKLLLNLSLVCCARVGDMLDGQVRVLDPLCGRGTSLNQALMYGYDSAGIERDGRAVDAYETFLKTWLQDKRLKHRSEHSRVRRDGKSVGRRIDIAISATVDDHRAGRAVTVTIVHDDTRHAPYHFKTRSFDAVVADLPYGVQHGSRTTDALERNPRQLVEEALPAWLRVLRRGGTVGLAWNTRVLPRADLLAVLAAEGLEIVDSEAMRSFAHRVDQSITRDLVVARLPA